MQPELATQADQGLMGAATALAHRLHLPTTLMKFLIVGGVAFLVYQLFLFLFYDSPIFWILPAKDTEVDFVLFTHPDIRLLISSVLAVELAIVIQFNSHERWTFRHRPRAGWLGLRFIKFNISSIVSPIIIVVTTNVLTLAFDVSPYLSSIVGVLIGFAWNWTMNSLVVWPTTRRSNA
jgi:dolichol-phosphate mannosyltransferase